VSSAPRVRAAAPEDAAALARLRFAFRAEIAPPREPMDAFMIRAIPWFHRHLIDPAWRGWVATIREAIVGHVFVQRIEKVPNPVGEAESLAYLTNFYVSPAHRGAGIGTGLLEAARADCMQDDVETIFLRPTGRSAELYLRNGYRIADFLERVPGGVTPGDPRAR
jgi:GNAT superfamily N-acetyltransferase